MKILFLCNFYHRAMIFWDSMNRLRLYGHEVEIFNAVVNNEKINDKYKDIMGSFVIHKECFNQWDRFFYHYKQNKIFKALTSSYNVWEFDLIHSHNLFNGGYVAYRIKKRFGVPYVVSVRNTDINIFLRIPLFNNIANRIVKEASGIQFLSAPYREKFISKYVNTELKGDVEKKSTVIYNGLEDFWLQHKAVEKKLDDEKLIKILYVGNIDKNKNIITTIKALNLLVAKGYTITFTVVGLSVDNSIFNEIQKVSFVKTIGYLAKEELIKIYRENDVYVMPSIAESFGRVYAEAMTQGLPVIYTQGQGFDGIFEDGCVGYSVPSNDPKYIAESIMKILADYSQISARCVEYSAKFDWNEISEKLIQFYFESLAREQRK